MKRSIGLWKFVGFSITSLLGTILHFLYEWLDGAVWIAPFSGVNESTWEHMKLLFWPMLFYGIFESFFFREREDFWCVKLRGMLFGLLLIPITFYTYNGVIGKSPDFINIAIFFISAAAAFIYETSLFKKRSVKCKKEGVAIALLMLIALLFVVLSFKTPSLAIFVDPTAS